MKDIFKRLTAKVVKPTTKPHVIKLPTLSSKLNKILAVFIAIVLVLCATAYYFFEAEITATTENIMQYFGDSSPVQTKTEIIHHAQNLKPNTTIVPISMVMSTSGIGDAGSGVLSIPTSISGVVAPSTVAASSVAASGITANGISNASAVMVPAQSSVANVDPVFDTLPDLPAPDKGPTVTTPNHQNYGNRPRNRDVRHCLHLGSNEAIARCVYPK
jgi:hypothetical protein